MGFQFQSQEQPAEMEEVATCPAPESSLEEFQEWVSSYSIEAKALLATILVEGDKQQGSALDYSWLMHDVIRTIAAEREQLEALAIAPWSFRRGEGAKSSINSNREIWVSFFVASNAEGGGEKLEEKIQEYIVTPHGLVPAAPITEHQHPSESVLGVQVETAGISETITSAQETLERAMLSLYFLTDIGVDLDLISSLRKEYQRMGLPVPGYTLDTLLQSDGKTLVQIRDKKIPNNVDQQEEGRLVLGTYSNRGEGLVLAEQLAELGSELLRASHEITEELSSPQVAY